MSEIEPTEEAGNQSHDGSARIRAKWGAAIDLGFQAVPDILLRRQAHLGLSATDLVVLLNVLLHWWYAGKKPYPRTTTIARRMGTTTRTVQRSLERMIQAGLLVPEKGPQGEDFLNPERLVARLNELAHDEPEAVARAKTRRSSTG